MDANEMILATVAMGLNYDTHKVIEEDKTKGIFFYIHNFETSHWISIYEFTGPN